jgi:hypothetical protein
VLRPMPTHSAASSTVSSTRSEVARRDIHDDAAPCCVPVICAALRDELNGTYFCRPAGPDMLPTLGLCCVSSRCRAVLVLIFARSVGAGLATNMATGGVNRMRTALSAQSGLQDRGIAPGTPGRCLSSKGREPGHRPREPANWVLCPLAVPVLGH